MIAQINIASQFKELIGQMDLKAKSELMVYLANEISKSSQPHQKKNEDEVVFELAGSWKDDRSVEEMIGDIRSYRTLNRSMVSIDA